MNRYVKCAKCNTRNELKSLFCVECGAKLDMRNVQHDDFAKRAKKERSGSLSGVFKVLRLVVLLVLLAGIGLMFWPPPMVAEVGDASLAAECRNKVARLHEACEDSIGLQMIFTEAEINAYLSQAAVEQAESGAGRSGGEVVLVLDKEAIEVVTTVKLGPVPLSYMVVGYPVVGGSKFAFEVAQARVGHLPVLGPPANFVAGQVARIFTDMEPERFVLDHLSRVELNARRFRVTTRGS